MATRLPTVLPADYTTQLATAVVAGGTSFTLQSNVDDDGVTLNDGLVYLTLDGSNSSKEHIQGVKTGASIASVYSVSRQGVLTSGVARTHRIGASVVCTDYAVIKYLNDLLKGTTSLDSTTPLGYDGAPSITTGNQLATKTYVDSVISGLVGTATESTYGTTKLSVAPASAGVPISVGDNDGRIPSQGENDALAGTSGTPSSTNKFVTDADTSGTGAILRTSAAPAVTDIQTYNASATWTKPTGALKVLVQAWAGGGGGGSQSASIGAQGGGGGGAYKENWFAAADLASTVEVTVGAAGAGATGGTNNATAGGNSYFSTGVGGAGTLYLTAFGGGFAYSGGAAEIGGAGGGGAKAVGANSTASTTGGVGGGPGITPGAGSAANTSNSGFGGGGGGTSGATAAGGDSAYGGGGGGAGSYAFNGGEGGYSIWGGGGGGGSSRDGLAAPGGTSTHGGAGGAGTKAGAGIAGSAPGGGGGGSGSSGTTGPYNGGNGGLGRVIVTTFF